MDCLGAAAALAAVAVDAVDCVMVNVVFGYFIILPGMKVLGFDVV